MRKNIVYHPLTATPFKRDCSYAEIAPCKPLEPYVRCFWGTGRPVRQVMKDCRAQIVIPDTCVDIIYYIDDTDHTVRGGFCGINDRSFYSCGCRKPGHSISVFAVRFYAWNAYVFAEDSFKSTVNTYDEIGARFEWFDRRMRPKLLDLKTMREKVSYAEQLLTGKIEDRKENRIINRTVNNMIANRGVLEVSDLAKESFISLRQLERLFHEYVGITPKKLSNLIRYQLLWRDIVRAPDFNILNAVHRYGYTDQSHLLREFKRYHSMDIHSARILAYKNVANIQDFCQQNTVE